MRNCDAAKYKATIKEYNGAILYSCLWYVDGMWHLNSSRKQEDALESAEIIAEL